MRNVRTLLLTLTPNLVIAGLDPAIQQPRERRLSSQDSCVQRQSRSSAYIVRGCPLLTLSVIARSEATTRSRGRLLRTCRSGSPRPPYGGLAMTMLGTPSPAPQCHPGACPGESREHRGPWAARHFYPPANAEDPLISGFRRDDVREGGCFHPPRPSPMKTAPPVSSSVHLASPSHCKTMQRAHNANGGSGCGPVIRPFAFLLCSLP
ncbi:hypothetical protein Plav_0860 [Parvibaculum lavamentivorans DS-1]|uniref:Uncharacterized protein n=1 Tax=Parvibaculum lavamentivorans (strain DS-1 / DSM 13023 / NCIMB 13966) TaxID=402881 RepID=A7HRF0_PARL1|nr:hypothetical protein Plav_0860 [Parvibaculum lavamentivorans DS-1]